MARLSDTAERIARHLVHVSSDGLLPVVDWQQLREQFSETSGVALAEAAHELQEKGFLRISPSLNAADGIAHLRPEYALYWAYDEEERGYPTKADIVTLARLLLENDELGSIPKLHEAVDWPSRRFNPPLAYLAAGFPNGRVSQQVQVEYPTRALLVTPEDRARLRGVIDELSPTPDPASSSAQPQPPATAKTATARIKALGFEVELPLARRAAVVLLFLVAAFALFWFWPQIWKRIEPAGFADRHPIAIAPENGAVFTHYPRRLELSWQRFDGAMRYVIEIEAQDLSTGEWFPHPGDARLPAEDTSAELEFIGSQPGRWRVTAISETGERSQASPWWEFFFRDEARGP